MNFDNGTLVALSSYQWPGNFRELENLVERLLIMRKGDTITADDLPDKIRTSVMVSSISQKLGNVINLPALEQLEREVVVEALERNGWNQTAAARFLSIPQHTLIYRTEKYGILPRRNSN